MKIVSIHWALAVFKELHMDYLFLSSQQLCEVENVMIILIL